MLAPEHFEVLEDYCCYRLSGHGRLAEAAGKVIEVITFAREQGTRNLLIDTTRWTGHKSPGTVERYQFALLFAEAAGSVVKLAMVVRPEMMDPISLKLRSPEIEGWLEMCSILRRMRWLGSLTRLFDDHALMCSHALFARTTSWKTSSWRWKSNCSTPQARA